MCVYAFMYVYIIIKRIITPQHIRYNSKLLGVVQSIFLTASFFCQKCTNGAIQLYIYVQ